MKKEHYSPYQTIELEHWKNFLQSSTMELQLNFNEIIQRIKNKNLAGGARNVKIGKLEFWHDGWQFDFWLEILDESENTIESSFGKRMLFSKNDHVKNPLKFNFIYPENLEIYYEEYRQEKLDREKHWEFFIWFSKNWIKCGGHQIGLLTTTEENSVRRIFNLNEINWSENVKYYYPKENQTIPFPLNRELTDYEIRKRVEFNYFPQFKTIWRYLEKDDEFREFGIYNYELYERDGKAEEFQTLNFKKQKFDRKEISDKINDLINEGFYEKQRPTRFPKVIANLIELELSSRSKEPRVQERQLVELERVLDLTLPSVYRFFITSIYDEQVHRMLCNFPINKDEWKKIDTYLSPYDIKRKYGHSSYNQKRTLPIAIATEKETISISLIDSSIYISSNENERKISNSFRDFIQSSIHISEYFCPRTYHIGKGNIATIKNWIENGWDMTDVKSKRSILNLSHNDKINTLLLKNGADPNKSYIYYDVVSPSYLQTLIDYGLDLEKKFEEDKWLKIKLRERGEFDEILKKYD